MENPGNNRTEPVRIHEVGVGSGSPVSQGTEGELPLAQTDRGRNSYFVGAWIIALLSTGLGALWLLGLIRKAPELPGNIVTVEPATGLVSSVGSNSGSTVLENLAELGPGLLLVGLCGVLALLIVQGLTRQRP